MDGFKNLSLESEMTPAFHLIRCRIGDEAYCFEMSSVESVCPATTLRRETDFAKRGLIGRITSPGHMDVPVFRLADRLERTVIAADIRHQHILVVRTSLGSQGFLADAVSRVIPVPMDDIKPVPSLLNDPRQRLFKSVVLFREEGRSDSLGLVLSAERLHQEAAPLSEEAVSTSGENVRDANLSAGPTNVRRLVLFSLHGSANASHDLLCGFSAAQVVEIIEPQPIVSVPLAPASVAGMILWRDQAVPVLRFHEWLGLPVESPARRMVIVRHAGELLALPTTSVPRARRLPLPHQPCVPPSDIRSEALWGAFRSESEVLVIPNLARLSKLPPRGVIL